MVEEADQQEGRNPESEEDAEGDIASRKEAMVARKASLASQEAAYYSVISEKTPDGRLMLGDDMEVFPDRECPEFSNFAIKAYEAKDKQSPGEQFVLLCGRSGIPRVTTIGSYKNIRNPHIIRLLKAGIVDWPLDGRQRFALVFDKPPGEKVLKSSDGAVLKVSEDRILTNVLEPAVSVISTLKNLELVHGAINLENIYYGGVAGSETLVLGECLSSAPSFHQHPIYEVTTRAMARADGRGPGTDKDDLYALGVCIVMMSTGTNLMAGRTPEEFINDKIQNGSFAAIVPRRGVASGVVEFLRGVLNDDEEQRWGIDEAERWLEGRHVSPKSSASIVKAGRPYIFKNQKHMDLRSIARSFSSDAKAAIADLDKKLFEPWLKRNFEDKGLKLRWDTHWEREIASPDDRRATILSILLDPSAPIRYKGLSFFPDGFSVALAGAITRGEDIQVYGEVITQQFLSFWINQNIEEATDISIVASIVEKCRTALVQKMPGYGIERVLYILNSQIACLSPILKNYFVATPASLLLALDSILYKGEQESLLLDRHIIAFLSVREPRSIDVHMSYVNSRDPSNRTLGYLRVLADIQKRFGVGAVPAVGNALIAMAPPLIERFKDLELRSNVAKQVSRLMETGNLISLLACLDDPVLVRTDEQRFSVAQNEYKNLMYEAQDIEKSLSKRRFFGTATGRQISMLFSSLLAGIIIIGYIAMRLIGNIF